MAENEIQWLEGIAKRPGMYLARETHVLHRMQAFCEGLKWASFFEENRFSALPHILMSLPEYVGQRLSEEGNGMGWLDMLLAQNKGDEEKAFQDLIALLIKAVEDYKVASEQSKMNPTQE